MCVCVCFVCVCVCVVSQNLLPEFVKVWYSCHLHYKTVLGTILKVHAYENYCQVITSSWLFRPPHPLFYFFFFLFGCACMWKKFPGQRLNLYHSNDPSHSSDNARSLTLCATRELLPTLFFKDWGSGEKEEGKKKAVGCEENR